MKQLLFASSNQSKLAQFQFVADEYGFRVRIVSAYEKFPELKTYSEAYDTQFDIVEHGAREVYAEAQKPVIVEDSILEVDALGGRPGLYAKEYLHGKGLDSLLHEMKGRKNRSARMISIVGYYDGRLFVSSKNVIEGRIAAAKSYKPGEPTWVGPTHHPFGGGFNPVFITNATGKTLAGHTAKEGLTLGYREPNFKLFLDLLA